MGVTLIYCSSNILNLRRCKGRRLRTSELAPCLRAWSARSCSFASQSKSTVSNVHPGWRSSLSRRPIEEHPAYCWPTRLHGSASEAVLATCSPNRANCLRLLPLIGCRLRCCVAPLRDVGVDHLHAASECESRRGPLGTVMSSRLESHVLVTAVLHSCLVSTHCLSAQPFLQRDSHERSLRSKTNPTSTPL